MMHDKFYALQRKFIIAIIILSVAGFSFIFLVICSIKGIVHWEKIGFISALSLVTFACLTLFSWNSDKIYILLLPFIIIAFPTAINDFFPSVYLGPDYEVGNQLFPIFTHIDLYLLFGVLRKVNLKRSLSIISNKLVVYSSGLFFTSSVINALTTNDIHVAALLVCGLFPIRYILLLSIIVANYPFEQNQKLISYSLSFSIVFLFVESAMYSKLNHLDVLASGSLASNTFANVVSAIFLYFVYLKRRSLISTFLFVIILMATSFIVVLSETRMAILAGIVSFVLVQARLFKWYKTVSVVLIMVLILIGIFKFVDLPTRYSPKSILKNIEFNPGIGKDLREVIVVKRTEATSSIYTRINLFQTAISMFLSEPIFGVGYGTFDYLKNEYGFTEYILIDAHNGYLNTISQVGLASIPFLYFIYWYPFFNYDRIKKHFMLRDLFIINTTIAIADLSNAGIYKPSVCALLTLSTLLIIKLSNRENA